MKGHGMGDAQDRALRLILTPGIAVSDDIEVDTVSLCVHESDCFNEGV
jgi:hypothetical protein